jgi:hypothetical protein
MQPEHITGRVWTVRLAPYGRPSAGAVTLFCSRPACADQRFPDGAVAGRKAAIGHVNMHLARIRAGGGPRGEAWCACRAADCAWHTPVGGRRGGARPAAGAVRCGGPVVLTVYADRAGRLWRIAGMCARCAAATADCRVLDAAPPPARTAPARADQAAEKPAAERETAGGTVRKSVASVFSDHGPSPRPMLRLPRPPHPHRSLAPAPSHRAQPPGGQSGGGKSRSRSCHATSSPTPCGWNSPNSGTPSAPTSSAPSPTSPSSPHSTNARPAPSAYGPTSAATAPRTMKRSTPRRPPRPPAKCTTTASALTVPLAYLCHQTSS